MGKQSMHDLGHDMISISEYRVKFKAFSTGEVQTESIDACTNRNIHQPHVMKHTTDPWDHIEGIHCPFHRRLTHQGDRTMFTKSHWCSLLYKIPHICGVTAKPCWTGQGARMRIILRMRLICWFCQLWYVYYSYFQKLLCKNGMNIYLSNLDYGSHFFFFFFFFLNLIFVCLFLINLFSDTYINLKYILLIWNKQH